MFYTRPDLDDCDLAFQALVWILFIVTTIAVTCGIWIALAPVTIWYLETYATLVCR